MGGGNKGGGGHTPYEAPDSLKSAQKLRAIGLISLGPIKGTVNKWKTTYFDNTPIQNANGKDDNDTDSFNFKNTEIQFTLGTQDQLPLKGFEASEREVPVNAEVKQAHPLTKTVIDPDVSRLRLTLAVSALFSQNDQGDTHGTSVTFQVLINNLPRNTYTIEGKSSSRFFRSYIIENLPEVPFTVTVKRVTEDSKNQRLQNATSWASYTEIIDTKLSYPNMALVGIKTDSRYNPNFPNINFLLHGRLVKIPSNYDPVARTYAAGIWKGDFKEDWTNNPAWVFYDLVTNKQIGLGERLGDFGVDKFQLYQIARYCDQLVPDGYGGQEPRMTANLWITDQRSAYEVLSDMASVFRAMVIWNGQQMTATQDRPTDPVCTYTQSNVIDGKFTRQYVAQKAIYTAVEVEYADKRNMYQKAIEYVADDDLIRRYGYNVKKITAFACTSRGQAHRYGKWVLETSRLEQCTITFSVGREGLAHLPGDIIEVADNRYANTNLGGRVLSVNGKTVTLDRPIDFTADSYLGYLSTVGAAEIVRVKILSVDDKQRVNLDREPVGLVENANWTLHTAQVKTQLYRAIGIAENEDGSFAITALQHEPQKEAIVDNGAVFEPRNTTILNTPKIDNIQIDVGAGSVNIQGDVSGGAGVVKYDIRIYKDGKLYDIQLGLNSPQIKLDNLPNGEYSVVIAVKNQDGQLLNEKLQTFTINRPPVPKNVRISGSLSDITLEWDWVDEVTQTEIFAAETDNIKSAVKIAKVLARTYSHTVGGRKVRYYWLRHVRGINNGAFYQETGLKGETGADIDKELELLNEKLSGKIVDTVIDTALPARNLELTKTVDGLDLNKFIGYNQVFNRADGKLYLWNGKQYTSNKSEVLAKDIQGIIGANQIAPIPTTQLQGTLSAQQIAANSIGTNHLQANVITADKLAANSVSAGALQAGAVRAEHVAAGQLTADKLAIGLGGNLLYNPIFANDAYGWRDFGAKSSNIPANIVINNHRRGLGTGDYTPKNALQTEMWQFMSLGGNNSAMKQLTNLNNWWVDPCRQVIRVTPGKQYIFSAYVACYNLGAFLYVEKWTTRDAIVSLPDKNSTRPLVCARQNFTQTRVASLPSPSLKCAVGASVHASLFLRAFDCPNRPEPVVATPDKYCVPASFHFSTYRNAPKL
ncbi:host specificity protein J [Aggregatibacter aphrophilus]|uniref:host specificity protein J n=1 Tax=Aggregatibacter aphrophilus TaxID=732 RepID=UPI0009F727DE|nr:phage tail protein [Aggregatibacter aphrophilus]PNL89899.1 host specificity protein J [Aggregatibacter aphrophilus]